MSCEFLETCTKDYALSFYDNSSFSHFVYLYLMYLCRFSQVSMYIYAIFFKFSYLLLGPQAGAQPQTQNEKYSVVH